MTWRNTYSVLVFVVVNVSIGFYLATASDQKFSGAQPHLQDSIPREQINNPRMNQLDASGQNQQNHVPATGTEFQNKPPTAVHQDIQQRPQYRETQPQFREPPAQFHEPLQQYHEPLPPGSMPQVNDPHMGTAAKTNQHIPMPPGSQPAHPSSGGGPPSKQAGARLTDPRLSVETNADNFGFQHATPGMHNGGQKLSHQQTELHTDSHEVPPSPPRRTNMDQVQYNSRDNIHTARNVDVRLEGVQGPGADNPAHLNPAAARQNIPGRFEDSNAGFDSVHTHGGAPSQAFHQPGLHNPSGFHSPEVRTADQFHGNPQSIQWTANNMHAPPPPSHDFIHQKSHRDHEADSAPDPYNQFRHSHEAHEHQASRPEATQRRFNTPREVRPDDTYVFPSADANRRGRSLSDDFVSMTLVVNPGTKECAFYVPMSNFILDYQVIRGGLLDIALFVKDPQGERIATRSPSPDGTLSIKVPPHFQLRPYAVCLDNRKASYADKHVSFSIDLDLNWENPSASERAVIEALRKSSFADSQMEAMDAEYMESWKALSDRMESLFGRLRRIEHLQQKTDNFASVDKALMEANAERVLRGSLIQIFIMLAVAGIQTLFIRAFFDSNSRFYRVWFGKRSHTSARC